MKGLDQRAFSQLVESPRATVLPSGLAYCCIYTPEFAYISTSV